MTGHQQNPTTGYNIKGEPAGKIDLEALCKAMGFNRVSVVDPYNLDECDRVLKEELAAEEPSVIISRRPCALLKYVKHKAPLKVESDLCVGCKSCMRLGCPAISIKEKKAVIDTTQCVGCGVPDQGAVGVEHPKEETPTVLWAEPPFQGGLKLKSTPHNKSGRPQAAAS